MLEKLKPQMAQFDELPARTRLIAVAAALVFLLFVLDTALITPQQKNSKALSQRIEAQHLELATVSGELAAAAQRLKQTTPVRERAALDDLQHKIEATDALIEQMVSKTPGTDALVKRLLDSGTGLKLISLKTIPVTRIAGVDPVTPRAAEAGPAPGVSGPAQSQPLPVYRHGIEIDVQGNYLAVLAYLEHLQGNPNRLFWGDMTMTTADYPNSVFHLTLYTLSSQAGPVR